jgi:DNA-directed RNA polymerase subunit M/transcription elongation factor TFIIS
MNFCPVCERATVRNTSSGEIVFTCPCGEKVKGGPHDARIGGTAAATSETMDMYQRLIASAPHDPVNQRVMCPPCPTCGLDYVAQLRISSAEVVIHRCKCGREW